LDPNADEDVRALMADIEASIDDLDRRLEAERQQPARKPAQENPRYATPGRPALPVINAEGSTPPEAIEASNFLAELEREAAEKCGSGDAETLESEARARRLHEALGRIFHFLNLFCRHTNALAPTIGRSYRLDSQITFADLAWHEATVRFRRQGLSEQALIDHVVFGVHLVAPAPITVKKRWDQIEALKKEMHLLALKTADDVGFDDKPQQEHVDVTLAPDLPVQLTFRANYKRNRVDLFSRNLDGFGVAVFVCAPEDVTQQMLDGLGRFLLSRADKLPLALHPGRVSSEP
jgi:hypothetical protein